MASPTFETALSQPDTETLHQQLQQLVVANDFETVTPLTAEQYLHAFCEAKSSLVRRRWSGLAFVGMIGASPVIASHLKHLNQSLHKLGAILLSDTEREETKIVAGLAIRQALQQGIEYNSFWSLEKVRYSVPSFPRDLGARWMANFQDFLDALHSLALAKSNNDTSIMYPVSLAILNEFKWTNPHKCLPVAIIQAGLLTVIIPNRKWRKIDFLDIPIDHIRSAQSQRSELHDSQARTNGHEPWDLLLVLVATPWSYRLNSIAHTETQVVFVFQHSADAMEWESCINEHQQSLSTFADSRLQAGLRPSSIVPIKCGNTQKDSINTTTSHPKERSSYIPKEASKPRTTLHSCALQDSEPSLTPNQDAFLSHYIRESRIVANRESIDSGKDSQATPVMGQSRISSQIRPPVGSDENHSTAKTRKLHKGVNSDKVSNGNEVSSRINAIESTTKSASRGQGKLPQVSRSAKEKALNRIDDPTEDLDMALNEPEHVEINGKHEVSTLWRTKPRIRRSPKRSTPVGHGQSISTKAPQSRAKRKANDDDDVFYLDAARPENSSPTKQKSSKCTETRHNKRIKRAHMEPSGAANIVSASRAPKINEDKSCNVPQIQSRNVSRTKESQQLKSKASEVSSSLTKSTRFPLIKGLTNSRSEATNKPRRPTKPALQPSTLSRLRVRPEEPPLMPQTPVGLRKQSIHSIASSPPPLRNIVEGSYWRTPRIEIDTKILSSNSKPIPASPNAESTAISGHANRKDIEIERSKADIQTAKNDPFQQRRINPKVTSFTRRLTGESANISDGHDIATTRCDVHHEFSSRMPFDDLNAGQDLEGDETLVNYSLQNDLASELRASSIYFPSSPPIRHSKSDHSSTSAEFDPALNSTLLPTSEAEDIQWEKSLNPHQRALHDILIRTSKHVLRHIVDRETAVTDIADIFERDGEHVLCSLLQRHESEYKTAFTDMATQGKRLQNELMAISKQLAKQRGHVRAIV